MGLRLVAISDTHNHFPPLPSGDVLIHAGDATGMGRRNEVERFLDWFGTRPFEEKILVAGNHDFMFETHQAEILEMCYARDIIYLHDKAHWLHDGTVIYGSPYQPWFHDWAFNLDRGPEIAAKWAEINEEVNILITHGPPKGVLDKTVSGESVGCYDLLQRIKKLPYLKVHIFGHIHEGYGWREGYDNVTKDVLYVNASTCTRLYQPTNAPIIIERDEDAWNGFTAKTE